MVNHFSLKAVQLAGTLSAVQVLITSLMGKLPFNVSIISATNAIKAIVAVLNTRPLGVLIVVITSSRLAKLKKKSKTYSFPLKSPSYVPLPLPGWNEPWTRSFSMKRLVTQSLHPKKRRA
jgi:hypothetical protein